MHKTIKEKAKKTYEDLCLIIKESNVPFSREDNEMRVSFSIALNDDPMSFTINVDESSKLVKLFSFIKINIPVGRRKEFALAICAVNNRIIDGIFDYDVDSGIIFYRISNSFANSGETLGIINYLLGCSLSVVDKYDNLFRLLAQGTMNLEEFLNEIFHRVEERKNSSDKVYIKKREYGLEIYNKIKNSAMKNGMSVESLEEMCFKFTVVGKDLKIPILISVDWEKELLMLRSPMVFGIHKNLMKECAIAVCKSNFGMEDGCFEYDTRTGILKFRNETSYSSGEISEEFFWSLLMKSCEVIDKYNDKFLVYGAV